MTGSLLNPFAAMAKSTIQRYQRREVAASGILLEPAFTCTADSNTTNHPYPRSTDPASGQALDITAVTSDTITVSVGVAQVTLDYLNVDSSSDFACPMATKDCPGITEDPRFCMKIGS